MSFSARLRTLASDAFVYGLANAVGRFLTFFLTPLYTNLIPPAELGPIGTLYSYIALAMVVYGFGMETAYLSFASAAEGRDPRSVFSTPVLFLAAAGLVFSTALTLLAPAVAASIGLAGHGDYVAIAAWILLLDSLQLVPFAYLRLRRQARAYAAVRLTGMAATVALSLLFLWWWRLGPFGILAANLLASALALVLLLPVFERQLRPRLDRRLLRQLVAFGLPLVPSGLSAMIVQVADRPILQLLTDDATVGIYQANYRLGVVMMVLVTVFQFAWQPFFLSRAGDADARPLFARVLTYYLVAAFALFLAVTLFLDRIVRLPLGGHGTLLGADYWPGLAVVPWVLLGYVALGVYTNFAAGPTLTRQTRVFPWVTGAAAAVNVGLNLILVPRFGMFAAAWTTLIAYLVMALGMGLAARDIYPVPYEWRRLARLAACGLAPWGLFVLLGGARLGLGSRLLLLAAYPLLLVASGFLERAEIDALRRRLRPPRRLA